MPDQETQLPPDPNEEEEARAARIAAWDETFAEARAAEEETPEGEPRSRGFWSGLGRNLASLIGPGPTGQIGLSQDATAALARGVTRGIDELAEFAIEDVGGTVVQYTPGLKSLVFDDEEREFFETWYEQRAHIETAVFGDDMRDKYLAYQNETLAVKMVESVTQFGAGFLLTGGPSSAATWMGRLAVNAGRGAFVDFAFFDPHEERLANVAQAFGIENEVIDFLAADEEDPILLGRIKNAMEGTVLGVGIDGVLEGFRALRIANLRRSGKITPEEAAERMNSVGSRMDEIEAREPEGPVRVVEGEDGTPHLAVSEQREMAENVSEIELKGPRVGLRVDGPDDSVLKAVPAGQKDWRVTSARSARSGEGIGSKMYQQAAEEAERRGGRLLSAEPGNRSGDAETFWQRMVEKGRATYDPESGVYTYKTEGTPEAIVPVTSRADAEMQAAAMNAAIERSGRPVGDNLRQVQEWQELSGRLAEAESLPELLSRQAEAAGSMPLGKIRDTRDMIASARAIEDMVPVQLAGKGGKVVSEEDLLRDVMEIFGDPNMTVEQMRKWAGEVFESTENLGAKMVGFRQVVMGHTHNLKQTARALARAPNNPWLATRLAEEWEALVDLSGSVTGTASNVGRALQSQQVPVGTLAGVPKGFEPHAQALAEFKSARRLYQQAIESGEQEAARAALHRMDKLGEQLGAFVGGKGRPKKHTGLTKIFDRDARRAAKAEAKAAQPELELEGLPPKPDVKQDIPGALAWHEKAVRQVEGQMAEARAAEKALVEEFNPSEAFAGFRGMSKEDIVALSRVLMATDDASIDIIMRAIGSAQAMVRRPTAPGGAMIRHLYISMLLSNPLTHARNIISNVAMAQAFGIERIWAGMPVRRWLKRTSYTAAEQRRLRQEGYDFLRYYWSAFSDGWSAGKKAWRLGENIMDPGAMRGDLTKLPTVGEEISVAAAIFRPSNINRFMLGADEVAQQMTYRAHAKMNAMRSARESGLSPRETEELLARVERLAFNEKGQAVLPEGIELSRDVTFKTALTDSKVGRGFQQMAEVPWLRATVLPFVRTPVNLWTRTIEHVPYAANISKRFRADIAAGGARAEMARARTELGGAVMATAGIMAASGMITGGGPEDPELRAQWRDLGNKPYAIRIPGTDTWIKYDRFDPIMTPVAFMADLVSVSKGMTEDGLEQELSEAALTVFAMTADRLSDRAYWGRIVDTFGALTSGDPNKMSRALGGIGGGYIPAVMRGMSGDEYVRQTWSVWDQLKTRVPGLDRTLEARRNIVGHKVMRAPNWEIQQQNPFEISFTIKDHDAWDRLMSIGRAFSMPSRHLTFQYTDEKLDMTDRSRWADERTPSARRDQSPYDRMLELSGTIRQDGKTMEEALVELANSEEFINDLERGAMRKAWEDAASIVSRFQDQAKVQMFAEYPALLEAYEALGGLGIGERVGNRSTIERQRRILDQ